MSVRPHFFRPILMKLCIWVEVDEWCTTVNCFHNQNQGQGYGGAKVVKYIPEGVSETDFRFRPKGSVTWHRTHTIWPKMKSEMTLTGQIILKKFSTYQYFAIEAVTESSLPSFCITKQLSTNVRAMQISDFISANLCWIVWWHHHREIKGNGWKLFKIRSKSIHSKIF